MNLLKNTKQYILTALYNATLTINNYYTMQYNNKCEEDMKEKEAANFACFSAEAKNKELLNRLINGF